MAIYGTGCTNDTTGGVIDYIGPFQHPSNVKSNFYYVHLEENSRDSEMVN